MNNFPLQNRKILLGAPPFAGHLYPIMGIALELEKLGAKCCIATGPMKSETVRRYGLDVVPMLSSTPTILEEIANTNKRAVHNPFVLMNQLRRNITLIPKIMAELDVVIDNFTPDLVLADFTATPLLLAATRHGLKTITIAPTPFAIENGAGPPSYLGGLSPNSSRYGQLRDFLGRKLIRFAKRSLTLPFRSKMKHLGLKVYREDGSEGAYSPDCILGLGMKELEFGEKWPAHFKMIGPVLFTPEVSSEDLLIPTDKKRILITLGTHLDWAKRQLIKNTELLRSKFPDAHFDYSLGKADQFQAGPVTKGVNYCVYNYIPYDQYVSRYDAVICHGGPGIVYQCILAGVPFLAFPLDYDQFDYAARIEHFAVGFRVSSLSRMSSLAKLRLLLEDPEATRIDKYSKILQRYDPISDIVREINLLLKDSGGNSI